MRPPTFGALCGAGFLITWMLWGIVFVVFGQVAVWRLRRDPATRHRLGMEFYPGWDIMNVPAALAWPQRTARWFDRRPLALRRADSQALHQHTSTLDRLLASICYPLQLAGCAWLIALGLHLAFR